MYLTEKCQTLKNLINFFLNQESATFCRTLNEKRAVFLSQIDFWDWEMDNLIYSFETFKGRSKVWEADRTIERALAKNNIMAKDKVIADIQSKRCQRKFSTEQYLNEKGEWEFRSPEDRPQTIEPIEELNIVIRRWNKLLDMCEKNILVEEKHLEGNNLNRFRKKEMEQ